MARGVYSVHGDDQAISTAITILELTAPSTAEIEIIRAWVSCTTVAATSVMARIRLLRKSGTITGTASPPSAVPRDASAASGATIKWKATGEGTDGTIYIDDSFNLLSGWLYLPVPEERLIIPPSGIAALKFPAAPTSANYSFGFVYEERG